MDTFTNKFSMLKEPQWKSSVLIHFETILKLTIVAGSLQQFNQVFPSRKTNTIERPSSNLSFYIVFSLPTENKIFSSFSATLHGISIIILLDQIVVSFP